MARVLRQGLDYFALDVHLDEKIELVEIKYGNDGFTVIIKLFQRIYGNGFYCKFTEDELLLFAYKTKIDVELVRSILNECLTRGVFNKDKYDTYNILTSKGIQCRYKEAVLRRKDVEVKEEYLLIDNNFGVKTNKDKHNVDTMYTSGKHVDNKSTQSKGNESKKKVKETICSTEVETIWSLYPKKQGKADSIKKIPKIISEYSFDEIKRCVERYSNEIKTMKTEMQYVKNGSTFFNGGYVDYLDSNYSEIKHKTIQNDNQSLIRPRGEGFKYGF